MKITTNVARSIIKEDLGIDYEVNIAAVRKFFTEVYISGNTKYWDYNLDYNIQIYNQKIRLKKISDIVETLIEL